MSNPELQALLANLRPRSQASVSNLSRERSREPSASFLTTSQIPSTPPPPFSPTPSQKSSAPSGSAIAQNLLNLLNFHQSTPLVTDQHRESYSSVSNISNASVAQKREEPATAAIENTAENSNVSGNRKASTSAELDRHSGTHEEPAAVISPNQTSMHPSHDRTQHTIESQSTSVANPIVEADKPQTLMQEAQTQPTDEMDKSQESLKLQPAHDRPIFTYTNPFEALKASRTNKSQSLHTEEQPTTQISLYTLSDPHSNNQAMNEVVADRVKLTPKSRVTKPITQQQNGTQSIDAVESQMPDVPNDTSAHSETPVASTERSMADLATHPAEEDQMVSDLPTLPVPDTQTVQSSKAEGRLVPVLSFPVKAFVSITLHLSTASQTFIREEGVMEISRLKKDFDQIDRSLAVASSKYITYAFVKNGGMRIIRQDDGSDRQVFKNSYDRIFNVSMSTTSMAAPPLEHQAILGTGISGAVYYATISRPGKDMFDSDELSSESLIFPAYPQADENTAGGALKTRAKRSSKHPDFFAIGRGKAIHIIWPVTVMSPRYGISDSNRSVDIERLFTERPLQILTGKAGKDFTFSEDDTMIVSLDKTGRLRFWDIRKLIDEENAKSVQITPYIIDTPVLSLSTASPAEKSWPTSVLFVDKARTFLRGGPLRYVLVGLRQNHTLQLWDIALGKAVQEINFPHESETDGICSVNFHSGSGIVAVGHPTRNSIFFIQLSMPRNNLSPALSQASYVQRVAVKDKDLPKTETTACMSGVREICFGARGQIRSVELLPVYKQSENASSNAESEVLFELYIVHSKGVTCIAISREDLGWNAENKAIQTIDAEKEGLVVLKELKLGSVIEENVESKSPVPETAPQPKSSKKKPKKSKESLDEVVLDAVADSVTNAGDVALSQPVSLDITSENVTSKESKKNKKKAAHNDIAINKTEPTNARVLDIHDGSNQMTEDTNVKTHSNFVSQAEELSMSISGDWLDKELRKIEKSVGTEFRKELDQLYHKIKSDRTLQDQTSSSRQEDMLRLVSTTLDNNVEKSLARILASQMQEIVVPSIVTSISKIITTRIMEVVSELVSRELGSSLPIQLEQTLQSPHMLLGIANNITQRLTAHVQGEITKTVNASIASTMKAIASKAANEIFTGYEARLTEQFRDLQMLNKIQAEKTEHTNQNISTMLAAMQSLSKAQTDFARQMQEEIRSLRNQTPAQLSNQADHSKAAAAFAQEHDNTHSTNHRSMPVSVTSEMKQNPIQPLPQRTQAEIDLDEISYLMEQQRYEEGSIKWLQSAAPHEIFNELFVRYTPDYLATDVSSLVAFSIGVTLANELSVNTLQRLEWINAAFNTVDIQDREIVELAQHAPQLINGVVTKLENFHAYRMSLNSGDSLLESIQIVAKKARELKHIFDSMNHSGEQSHVID